MSRDRPSGAELLAIAAQVLRREVLPHVAPEKRLETLMVARSMAIAEREIQDAGAGAAETSRALRALYADGAFDTPERSEDGWARLAADIRAGRFDAPDLAKALHALLLADVTRRLRIANPRYLDSEG